MFWVVAIVGTLIYLQRGGMASRKKVLPEAPTPSTHPLANTAIPGLESMSLQEQARAVSDWDIHELGHPEAYKIMAIIPIRGPIVVARFASLEDAMADWNQREPTSITFLLWDGVNQRILATNQRKDGVTPEGT